MQRLKRQKKTRAHFDVTQFNNILINGLFEK